MTDTALIALVGVVPATIIATATLITSIRNGKKAEVIREQTDGHLTKLTEQLKAAHDRIAELKDALPKPKRL